MYDYVDRPLARQERGVQLFVWVMRHWARAALDGRCVCALVDCAFRGAELTECGEPFHRAMRGLCRRSLSPLRFGAIERSTITEDEAILISALVAATEGRGADVAAMSYALVQPESAPQLVEDFLALGTAFLHARLSLEAVGDV